MYCLGEQLMTLLKAVLKVASDSIATRPGNDGIEITGMRQLVPN
jgi:hypothetical protein